MHLSHILAVFHSCPGTNLDAITTCELCKEKLHLNIENFDINELHRTHEKVTPDSPLLVSHDLTVKTVKWGNALLRISPVLLNQL